MSKDRRSRRRFLQATGAATLTAAVAGCTGGGDGDDGNPNTNTSSSPDTSGGDTSTGGGDTTTSEPAVSHDSYPYGLDETRVDEAQRVMEEAGYGPDNRYELNWLQYANPSWKEMAKTIRGRLEAAYIDMNISSAAFNPLLNQTRKGQHEAYTLGWIADYPGPKNFVQLVDPPNTVYDNSNANGARLFWSEDAYGDSEVRQFMLDQFDRIAENPQSTEEARRTRLDATKKMEEGMWESAGLIPIYHRQAEYFWYDYVDVNVPGAMGSSRAKTSNQVEAIEGKDRLSGLSGTMGTLDPIASGNTASGGKIMNMFDALTNYPNGQTNVETLLAESYEVSDDFTTYTFKLKEGVQFHGDYGEVTADDVVYSIKRLMGSTNSTNARFPLSVMSITHDTKDVTITVENEEGETTEKTIQRAKLDTIGVRKTGEYEVEVEVDQPFSYALSVLAYSAFSVVPEGIVGDVPGYEGEMEYQDFATSNPVGCGPFEFGRWESGVGGEFVLETFEDYHGEPASFDGIDDTILSKPGPMHTKFLNQESDFGVIPDANYDKGKVSIESTDDRGRKHGTYGPLENGETAQYAQVPEPSTFYIGFNMEKVPKPVRQAMAYVVNHQQFAQKVFKGRNPAAYHLTPPQVFPGGVEGYDAHYQG
jgi:peptide/nickel transport system substrate-binding protein